MAASNRNRLFALLMSLGILAAPNLGFAQGVEASRARIDQSHLSLQNLQERQCWARYSVQQGQSAAGQIEEVAFRVPCPEVVTSGFIATLQRALEARGHYTGAITGRPNEATRDAIRAFQRANGFDSPILTLETAQRLGLMPVDLSAR